MALAVDAVDGELYGETGFPALMAVAKHCLTGTEISDEEVGQCEKLLDGWIENQDRLQDEAFQVVIELEGVMPTTDLENMPAWPWTDWGKTLRHPWSGKLQMAINTARAEVQLARTASGE